MPSFRYEAIDANSHISQGLLDADSLRAARSQLRTRGLTPIEVYEVQAQSSQRRKFFGLTFGSRLSDADLSWTTRQLAGLLAAQLPLDTALAACSEQADKSYIRDLLTAVRNDVRAGFRFADALAQRPDDFPDIYRALIAAGEASGKLPQIMEDLASYLEERNLLRTKVSTAFIYPGVVAAVSFLIMIFLLGYVVPQVVSAFSQSKQALPLLTRLMLGISDAVRQWWWLAGLIGLACATLIRIALKRPALEMAWHTRLLSLPLVSKFSLGLNSARFASTLAILSGAGVPLLQALEAARLTLSNAALRAIVTQASQQVREGASLAKALGSHKRFPPLLIHLIASGERTGTLADMLARAARSLGRDLERRALVLTALLEPALILSMGLAVLLIVLAVLMPIIQINQLIK